MITKLSIVNFKSIRQLDIDCRKINLFIGEPNTGKSNILEALALLSYCGLADNRPLSDYVRFQTMPNLFYDQLLDRDIVITALTSHSSKLEVILENDGSEFQFRLDSRKFRRLSYEGDYRDRMIVAHSEMKEVKFFRFRDLVKYDDKEPGSLKPPDGINLFSVVFSAKALREMMGEFFRRYGLKLVLKPQERVFELQRQADDLVFSLPYSLASDTLRRVLFYVVAIASNEESVLVFEEPESNAFPYYTKYLGERIALDETNQFFIATHNPYLLSAIIEKGPKEDVQVFITYFKDHQTKVRPLTPDEVTELMEADPFFNLDRFVEEGQ